MSTQAAVGSRGQAGHPQRRQLGADLLFALFGVAIGLALAAPVVDGTLAEVHTPGGSLLAASTLTGLVGTAAMWIMVVLASRVPLLDRVVGQPAVMRWHRLLAPWAVGFVLGHVVLAIGADALAARAPFLRAAIQVASTSAAMVAATVAGVVVALVGAISFPAVRARIPREHWWLVHLLLYAAIVLAIVHELALGPTFVTHPAARAAWIIAWAVAGLSVLSFRVVRPWARSRRLALSVVGVRDLGGGRFTEVRLSSRHQLHWDGGQYLLWRFHHGLRALEAHPFTVLPGSSSTELRLVARRVGDFTSWLADVPPGTRVSVEGPYGAFTLAERRGSASLLVAGGAGQTAVLALLGDLDAQSAPQVVLRVHDEADAVLLEELTEAVRARGGELRLVVGSRREVPLAAIFEGLDDLGETDVWIAGPPEFVRVVEALAVARGARSALLHADPYAI